MYTAQRQGDFLGRTRAARRRVQAASLALLAAFLLAVPTIRTGETNEVSVAKERVEDAAFTTRTVGLMRTAVHGRREAIVFTSSIQARLGREQQHQPLLLAGHRLPNGLMAPMTC
jgi:hypothetical protein